MMREPMYDPKLSYEDNYENGPFGGFADGVTVEQDTRAQTQFLGVTINYPLGIPAGPLLNAKYIDAAFCKGFDLPVYKTVRTSSYPCHAFPNILAVHVDGDLTPQKAKQNLVGDTDYREPLSITNSFGVPSQPKDVWISDAVRGVESAGVGQAMIMSWMGTVREGGSEDDFVADYAYGAELAMQTGAKIFEINLSCPNLGNEGLVCYNLATTRKICKAVREKLESLPFIIKIGYFADADALSNLLEIANEYVDGIASINTIVAPIVDCDGDQALPGNALRLRSGVCGASIKWAGLEMVSRLKHERDIAGTKFAIVGCGGVMNPQDFRQYRDAGADVVMTATGAMWNPYLAQEIREMYPNG